MTDHKLYMRRCLELAASRYGYTAPNPMVGAVIVCNGKIISEGKHFEYGAPHAEAEAINNVSDKSILKDATLYVNLEPCCHYGKTPPCTTKIIEAGISRVIVGSLDPNPKVNGQGIAQIKSAGIHVEHGILEAESIELNKFFYTFHTKKRPYIFFKWAQTLDGYIDIVRDATSPPTKISGTIEHMAVHKWRAATQSIMVGTNTVILDNPQLTVRAWSGKNPIRIVVDRNGKLNSNYLIFQNAPTIVFTPKGAKNTRDYGPFVEIVEIDMLNMELEIINELYMRKIMSLMIEGGTEIITSFIKHHLWDEARVFIAPHTLGYGIAAPQIHEKATLVQPFANGQLVTYKKTNAI